MPLYTYINDSTGKKYDVVQGMNDKHCFFDPETGEECRRIFYAPNASVDSLSSCDAFDTKKQVEKTGAMKGTMGDLFDASKEFSERRAEKLGHEDPVKKKFFEKYQKETGKKHLYDKPSKIETKHATIDFAKPFIEPKLD